jgi:cytochrome oxidase Cu insertion factor (SCO1/SenC/PrrC family)
MKRLLPAISLFFAAAAFGQEFKLGSKVGNFNLTDLNGQTVNFSALKGNTTVVLFVATKCPISNAYNERMSSLYNDYAAKGVKFVFINSNHNEPAGEVAEHARQHAFPFTVYKGNAVADRFGAQVTPEAFVLDSAGIIRYHGYIDDAQNPARIQKQGLRLALDAVMAGKSVESAETKAFGCTIKREKRVS